VPESGDEVQHIKSGLMEIADCFVVNKADREGAGTFANNLKKMVHEGTKSIPVLQTVADKNIGIDKLMDWITAPVTEASQRKEFLFAEKAWKIIQHHKMQLVDKKKLKEALHLALQQEDFNVYRFADDFISGT